MESWQLLIKEKDFNDILMEWNKKINLVSRKKTDVYDLIEDSKLFLEAINFSTGLKILDLGTGGGFPGIVIAIHHPEAQFTLVDSIQKKVNVVSDIAKRLGLKNVEVICIRAEDLARQPAYKNKFDFIVARSVAVLQDLVKWSKDLIKPDGKLIAVKGGDIRGEIRKTKSIKYVKNIELKTSGERITVIASL